MQDLKLVWEILTGSITQLYELIIRWIGITIDSGLSPSVWTLVKYFIFINIFLFSGFLGASFAEKKRRNRPVHFTLSLLVPYLYPVMLYFLLPVKKDIPKDELEDDFEEEKEENHSTRTDKSLKLQVKKHDSGVEIRDFEQSVETDELEETIMDGKSKPSTVIKDANPFYSGEMNQHYFSMISVDENGNSRGPFMFELNDGKCIEVLKIVTPQENILVLEMAGEGDKPRTIRLPYDKINRCCLTSDWMQ